MIRINFSKTSSNLKFTNCRLSSIKKELSYVCIDWSEVHFYLNDNNL